MSLNIVANLHFNKKDEKLYVMDINTDVFLSVIDKKVKENIFFVSNKEEYDKIETEINNGKTVYIILNSEIDSLIINTVILYKCDNIFICYSTGNGDNNCKEIFPDIPYFYNIYKYIVDDDDVVYLKYKKNPYYLQQKTNNIDIIYNDLVNKILINGIEKEDRTGTGVVSSFAHQIKIDVSKNAPLLTCKKVAWKTCIKELLWFLRGETDSKILEKQGVRIWEKNSSREFLDKRGLTQYEEGEIGKAYGWQIRHSGGDFKTKTGGVDQLEYIENLLKTDPSSRRILWNLWIPQDLDETALTPCHYAFQLYTRKVEDTYHLSGMVNIRSNDMFLGNPFNIFSYYVLIMILCERNNMVPDELILSIGDAHIYKNHLEKIKEQISRPIKSSPKLVISKSLKYKKWEEISIKDFDVIGYFPHPVIKADMAV